MHLPQCKARESFAQVLAMAVAAGLRLSGYVVDNSAQPIYALAAVWPSLRSVGRHGGCLNINEDLHVGGHGATSVERSNRTHCTSAAKWTDPTVLYMDTSELIEKAWTPKGVHMQSKYARCQFGHITEYTNT